MGVVAADSGKDHGVGTIIDAEQRLNSDKNTKGVRLLGEMSASTTLMNHF